MDTVELRLDDVSGSYLLEAETVAADLTWRQGERCTITQKVLFSAGLVDLLEKAIKIKF